MSYLHGCMKTQTGKEQRENASMSRTSDHSGKAGKGGTRVNPPPYSCNCCAECAEEKSEDEATTQLKEHTTGGDAITPPSDNDKKGSLPAALQFQFQNDFGFNLGSVNIHENSKEAEDFQANAFTRGNDIFFSKGNYDPKTSAGVELIAHELSHVSQNQKGTVSQDKNSEENVNTDQSKENEAIQKAKSISNSAAQNQDFQSVTQFLQNKASTKPAANRNTNAPAQFDIDFGAVDIARKISIIRQIANINWMKNIMNTIDKDAHPQHRAQYIEALWRVLQSRYSTLIGLATRTTVALSSTSLTEIESEYAAFVAEQAPLVAQELSAVNQMYKTIEMVWLYAFIGAGEMVKDPTNLNQSGKTAKMEFDPGFPGTVTIVTRVTYNFRRTPEAITATIDDWTDDEKQAFKDRFQQQLDDVYNTSSVEAFAPFRVDEPEDYLLKDSVVKWSEVTAHMRGEVEEVDGSGTVDFAIDVFKTDGTQRPRASVGGDGKSATFYDINADRGYNPDGTENGDQHTLAHEWMHMIGQPDEYAENSQSQSSKWIADGSVAGSGFGSDQWSTCETSMQAIVDDTSRPQAERDQAAEHLEDLRNPFDDSDSSTPGTQRRLYNTAGHDYIPDECFAVRGRWSGPQSNRLRPGGRSQRGGTNISQNMEDQMRISHAGNNIHAYHREGTLVELNSMLEERSPKVQFEHNFQDLGMDSQLEVLNVRLNNIHWDIIRLVDSIGGSAEGGSEEVGEGHNHGNHDGHNH